MGETIKSIVIGQDGKPRLVGVWTIGELAMISQWLLSIPIQQGTPENGDDQDHSQGR